MCANVPLSEGPTLQFGASLDCTLGSRSVSPSIPHLTLSMTASVALMPGMADGAAAICGQVDSLVFMQPFN